MEDLLKAIANLGFLIAVATYLLIRIEGKMDNSKAMMRAKIPDKSPTQTFYSTWGFSNKR